MQELVQFLKSRHKATLAILFINVAVFIVLSILGDVENSSFMLRYGAEYPPLVVSGEYYRLFTCMFLHFGIEHLIGNMLMFVFLGDALERAVGTVRFVIIYLLGGVCGNVLSCFLALKSGEYAVSAGASGALFAVIGALVYIAVRTKGNIGELSGRRLMIMAALSVLQGFAAAGVDGAAHFGGFAGGFVLAFLLGTVRNGNLFRHTNRND